MGADKLGKIDAKSGQVSEIATGAGSAPRRMAAAPDGTLWVTLNRNGKLLHFDPVAGKKIREYDPARRREWRTLCRDGRWRGHGVRR
jgi:streptogramin lyase